MSAAMPAHKRVTVVMTTSPSPVNPLTYIIDMAINSVSRVIGLEGCEVVIVMDHYHIVPVGKAKPKQGKVTEAMAANYEQFEINLRELYTGNPRVSILRCDRHHGFSLAVKRGLAYCKTEFALICQHDRFFKREVRCIDRLLQMFEEMPFMRYIGFPSVSSNNHHQSLLSRYQLSSLLLPHMRPEVEEDLSFLQPSIFWFDSQHLCHVGRYLRIYEPYRHASEELKGIVAGLTNGHLSDMILRPGDFTEDRLGQMQRKVFVHLKATTTDDGATINRIFLESFGSYLYYSRDDEDAGAALYDRLNIPVKVSKVVIVHVHARRKNGEMVNFWRDRAGRERIPDYEDYIRTNFA